MLSKQLISLALLLSPCLASNRGPGIPQSPVPPKVDPTKLDFFDWLDPFSSPEIQQFDIACESSATFSAFEFQLHDLSEPEPLGLLPLKEQLAAVFHGASQYPGGWDGMDAHGYERNLLKMEYKDVPVQVREWIGEQERSEGPAKGFFAVLDKPAKDGSADKPADTDGSKESPEENKVVLFAPGALYGILPLWVAQDSGCEDALTDLSKYSNSLVDGGVVGWPTKYTTPSRSEGKRSMSFTLKARVLKNKASTSEESDKETVETEGKDEL